MTQPKHACAIVDRASASSAILFSTGTREVGMTSLASELGLAPRTLQRRLAEEGVSLRELLRRYRISKTASWERSHDRNRTRLAHALGYADGTSLWRAQRTWSEKGRREKG